MGSLKRKRDDPGADVVPATIVYLKRGDLSILSAISAELPDVFTEHLLQKLDLRSTLNLAQVNKTYRDAVWSVGGVRSMRAKIKTHLIKIRKKNVVTTKPYYWATRHGNVPAVRACLESGVDVNKVLTQGDNSTALHVAALRGHAAVVKALIEAGADVNKIASAHAVDTSGKRSVIHNVTPVYFAAEKGHTPCVMELITAGADVNLARNDGCTALYMAARLGHEVCVALLIQAGADIHKAANHGWTPLATAVNQKHKKIVALLKHFGTA